MRTLKTLAFFAILSMVPAVQANAQGAVPGVSQTEIKIGQTQAYSGPLSVTATFSRTIQAYFTKINKAGGINGRKLTLVSLDDAYSPPKTVELTRQLVERDGVFFMFGSLGGPTNAAVEKYLNDRKVPQLMVVSTLSRFNNPKEFPWTTPGLPSYRPEVVAYANYIKANKPNAKIAILSQDDDVGRDFVAGLKQQLGDRAKTMIVAEQTYEVTDPVVDSQMINLAGSGADTLFSFSTQKATAQAIRKAASLNWHPTFFIPQIASSIDTVLKPAGLKNSVGLISTSIFKELSDPRWKNDPGVKAYFDFMKKYYPGGNPKEQLNVSGYNLAFIMAEVLKRCGNDLTRENLLKQATTIKDLHSPMMLPGVSFSTSPSDYDPYKRFQLVRFDGKYWQPIGTLGAGN